MKYTKYPPGMFCWMDLRTPDAPSSMKFYKSVFDWGHTDIPMGEGMLYSMLTSGDANIGAMYQDSNPESRARWDAYVCVSDVDAMAARAVELGGSIVAGPMDAMEAGRLAAIADPAGAIFCMWQPLSHAGFGMIDEPGSFCWVELNTHDPVGSAKFYWDLFNWKSLDGEDGSGHYTHFICGDHKQAGMMQIQKEWGDIPSHWLPYIQVEGIDDTVAAVKVNGGQVHVSPMKIEGTGICAVFADPHGAIFGAHQLIG